MPKWCLFFGQSTRVRTMPELFRYECRLYQMSRRHSTMHNSIDYFPNLLVFDPSNSRATMHTKFWWPSFFIPLTSFRFSVHPTTLSGHLGRPWCWQRRVVVLLLSVRYSLFFWIFKFDFLRNRRISSFFPIPSISSPTLLSCLEIPSPNNHSPATSL